MKDRAEIEEFVKDNISKLPYITIEVLLDCREFLREIVEINKKEELLAKKK